MTIAKLSKILLVLSLLTTALPATAIAKPNGYPGENSTFKPHDPVAEAKRKADRQKRKELRKKRREERKLKRLNTKNNRSN